MKDKSGNFIDPHFGMKFGCSHCEKQIQICNNCNGHGYYYDETHGKNQRENCKLCNCKGIHHV